MVGLAVLSEPFIRIVLTDKWLGVVPYIQIMCFAYMWNPIMQMTLDLLNAKHRSDYSLKSEIVKKITAFCILFATIPFGVRVMCVGLILYSMVDMLIIVYFVKKILPDISLINIVKEIYPVLLLACLMGSIIYIFRCFVTNMWLELLMGFILGCIIYIGGAYIFKFRELKYMLQSLKLNR